MQIDMDMMLDNNEEYERFVDKFKPKLTTDDCYTPEAVYDAVRGWVFRRYQLPEDTQVVRPFWPGADYTREEYPDGCVVIDNPPFSIIGEIEQYYLKNRIRFFLFAPALTIFKPYEGLGYVLIDKCVTYANGAQVPTSFVTNMSDYLVETPPDLYRAVREAEKQGKQTKTVPKYELPAEVATSARLRALSRGESCFYIRKGDAVFVRNLDTMKRAQKGLFGGGLLLNAKAAAEKAAAEKAAAEKAAAEKAAAEKAVKAEAVVWGLSEREREIIGQLS